MKMRLAQYETFPVSVALDIDVETFRIEGQGIQRLDKGRLELDIQESGEEYYCQGNLIATVAIECARCLKPYKQEIDEKINFIACSVVEREKNKDVEDSEEYVFFQNSEMDVDLTETICEAVLLGLPMKPVCIEDCPGL